MTREERDKALKVLKNYDLNFHKINGMLFSAEEIANAFDIAIKALEQEPRWISSDNPPKRAMRVLVDYEITRYMGVKRSIRDVGIGCYCNGWHIENHNGEKVEMKIHKWMPLPESEDNK